MLRDEGVVVESSWGSNSGARERHREIDRELRRIAARKAGLEAEEARWLREAERHRIWRALGYSTALEYLEGVFGYAPRTAKDRLRVAKELGELPALEAQLREGALPYSAVRELTRVMTPANEAQWLARVSGKNVHDVQLLVTGHKKGDSPDAPKDPALMTRTISFELDTRQQALLQQVRAVLEAERGEHIESADLLELMCMRVLAGAGADAAEGTATRPDRAAQGEAERPMHQVVVRTCETCSRAWQQGRGPDIEISSSNLALAACDAEMVREADIVAAQAAGKRRPAPTLSIPKKTRALVMARDQRRCRFPGCRATRHVAVHHIVPRAHGGSHEQWNLVVLCDGHHKLLHGGLVTITGHAPGSLVFTRGGTRLVDSRTPQELVTDARLVKESAGHAASSRLQGVVELEHATQALRQLGFKTRAAKRALELARAQVGANANVATLVKAVLAMQRTGASDTAEPDTIDLATRAIVQSGFSARVAQQAIAKARAHVGIDVELAALIKEALRFCA